MKPIGVIITGVIILVLVIILWPKSPPSSCPGLSIKQQNAGGTFLSLSMTPLKAGVPPEVAPARIRAYRGDEIVWVFRNPSGEHVAINLYRVRRPDGSTDDIKSEIFLDLGGMADVPENCNFGFLRAILRPDIKVMPDSLGSCSSRTVFYDFMIHRVGGMADSTILECPYDPELVIEGQP